MKKIFSFLIVMTIGLFAAKQIANAQQNDDFAKMTFEANLGKTTYLLLEPVQVKFKFSNRTDQPQTTLIPLFLQESKLKVVFKDQTTVFNYLTSVTGKPYRFDVTFEPGKTYEEEEMLATGLEAFFTEAGDYRIQFILSGAAGTETLASNVINVTIERPMGVNKQAFDFLKKHESSSDLFGWSYSKEAGQALLETFVERYGASVYGELAISNLGYVYKSQGELEKARAQFKKLESSKNKSVAEDAKSVLTEIDKKIGIESKSKSH